MVSGLTPPSPNGSSDSGFWPSPQELSPPPVRTGIDVRKFTKYLIEESGWVYRGPNASGTEGSDQTERGKEEARNNQSGLFGASRSGLPSETGLVSTNGGSFLDWAESQNREVNQAKLDNVANGHKQRDFMSGQTVASDDKFSAQSACGKRINLLSNILNGYRKSKYSVKGQSSLKRVEGQSREVDQAKYGEVDNSSSVRDFPSAKLHSSDNGSTSQSAHGNIINLATYSSSGIMVNSTSIQDQSSHHPTLGSRERTPSTYAAQNKFHMNALKVNENLNSTKLAVGELMQYHSIPNHQPSTTFCELTPCPAGQLMDYNGYSFRNELQESNLGDTYYNMTAANASEGKGMEPPNSAKQDFGGKLPTPKIEASPADLGEPNPNFEDLAQSMKRSFEYLEPPTNETQRRQLRRLYQLTANNLRLLSILKEDGPN